ncbi:MAG: molybdopterin-binding protein, partial [Paracoccaceae bacterium]
MIDPPELRDDCFALPPGVDWVPVPEVFELLKLALGVRVKTETVLLSSANGRFLAEPVFSNRSSPPFANSAIDGYGFAGHQSRSEGPVYLRLVEGRAAAGHPYNQVVPEGSAVRILTGAVLPDGVDTVVLQEDVNTDGQQIAFRGPLKIGKNTRLAGEDIQNGQLLFDKGHRVCPPDLAVLASVGVSHVTVFAPLRVGVLSTGDELLEPGGASQKGDIFDANRQMLLSQMASLGFYSVDFGIAADDASTLRKLLNNANEKCDVLLTTGGASAGDEDHMSSLLRREGALNMWRIAVKPGRPMAMGLWKGLPVFGLPGNPVAALVCTLVFAQPALRILAGGHWKRAEG